jgi:hypothetical protein
MPGDMDVLMMAQQEGGSKHDLWVVAVQRKGSSLCQKHDSKPMTANA